MGHYLQLDMAGGAGQPMLEGHTTLGFLAAHTRTVQLQLLVTGITYRTWRLVMLSRMPSAAPKPRPGGPGSPG